MSKNNPNAAAEKARLERANRGEEKWRRWGPYVSNRQWGTVREDYSADGNAWDYLSHVAKLLQPRRERITAASQASVAWLQ